MYRKCCFCIPLRIGILIWSYLSQIYNIAKLVMLIIYIFGAYDTFALAWPRVLTVLLLILNILIAIVAYPSVTVNPKAKISIFMLVLHVLFSSGYLIWSYHIRWIFVTVFYHCVSRLLSAISFLVLMIGIHKDLKELVQSFLNFNIISTAFIAPLLIIDFLYFFIYIFLQYGVQSDSLKTYFISSFTIRSSDIFIQVFLQLYMMYKIKKFLENPNDNNGVVYKTEDNNESTLL